MIRRLLFGAGIGVIAKTIADRVGARQHVTEASDTEILRDESDLDTEQSVGEPSDATGHVPTDLLGDEHPDGSERADDHFRPDPGGSVDPEDRESMRPVTLPAPHDLPGR